MADHPPSVAVAVALAGLTGLAAVGLFAAPSAATLGVFGLGLVGAGALSLLQWKGSRQHGVGMALVRAAVPLCIYLAATTAVVTASGHDRAWDTARLLPSIAWVHGHDVYATQGEGAVQTTMYPPFWVVSYAPAALATTPRGALQIGTALTLLFSLAPVLWILLRSGASPVLALLGFAGFVFVARLLVSLEYSVFQVHADAPSLGLALAACAVALRTDRPARWHLPATALLAWLSVWTKHVMLPVLAVLPLWLLLVQGRGPALRLLLWIAGTGVVVAAFLLALFPADAVWFNTVTLPARAPWRLDGLDEHVPRALQLVDAGVELLRHALPLLFVASAGAFGLLWLRGADGPAPPLGSWLRTNPWTLPLGMAVAMVPVCVLGRAKVGGDANTLSPTTYFLLVACILQFLRIPALLSGRPDGRAQGAGHGFAQPRQAVLAFLACVSLSIGGVATAESYRRGLLSPHISRHPTQVAFEYLRTRDAQAFFPTHPLAHLLADGSLPHLAMALHDREFLSELPLSPAHRSAFLPAAPSMVCWDWSWGVTWVARHYFTDYLRETDPPDLDDHWECYVRGPAAGSARPAP